MVTIDFESLLEQARREAQASEALAKGDLRLDERLARGAITQLRILQLQRRPDAAAPNVPAVPVPPPQRARPPLAKSARRSRRRPRACIARRAAARSSWWSSRKAKVQTVSRASRPDSPRAMHLGVARLGQRAPEPAARRRPPHRLPRARPGIADFARGQSQWPHRARSERSRRVC